MVTGYGRAGGSGTDFMLHSSCIPTRVQAVTTDTHASFVDGDVNEFGEHRLAHLCSSVICVYSSVLRC